MTPNESLAAAVIAIYTTVSVPLLFIIFKHGIRSWVSLGWVYLFLFFTLKIVGAAMELAGSDDSSANIVGSIGLSPLLLATAGILHEARFYRSRAPGPKTQEKRKIDLIAVLSYHILVMSGIALVAVGISNLSNATTDVDRDYMLAVIGVAILLVAWIALVCGAVFMAMLRSVHDKGSSYLLIAVLLCLPFVGVRTISSLVFFATRNRDLSAAGGKVGFRVGLYLVQEWIVSFILVGAGLLTRNIRRSCVVERRLNDSISDSEIRM